jgi:MYXO-CTERM domain-containing protein
MRSLSPSFATISVLALATSSALAVTNPFTESFNSSSANWSSASAFTAMTYFASGGVGNSGYAGSSVSFTGQTTGAQPILARAQSNFSSSNNEFFGNWIASGVAQLSLSVRQNTGVPVTYFVRFAPAAGPGAVAVIPVAVQPNTWTNLSLAINASTPFIYEGTTFSGAFSDVSRVQVGVLVDAALADQAGPFAFDVDNVAITPAPGALGLLGVCGLIAGRRRR